MNAVDTHRPCMVRGEKGGNNPPVALTSYSHLRLIDGARSMGAIPRRGLGQ
jgi:hypothetical protein